MILACLSSKNADFLYFFLCLFVHPEIFDIYSPEKFFEKKLLTHIRSTHFAETLMQEARNSGKPSSSIAVESICFIINNNFLTRIPEPVSTTYAPLRGVCVRTKGIKRFPVNRQSSPNYLLITGHDRDHLVTTPRPVSTICIVHFARILG